MESEVWKDVPSFEGVYMVSNKGNIKRLAYNRSYGQGKSKRIEDSLRNLSLNPKTNVVCVSLSDGFHKKNFHVARLVYQVFNNVKLQRNHIILHQDGNKLNCALDNLKLITKRNFVAIKMENSTGYTGVSKANKDDYVSKIDFEGITIQLHFSKDKEECHKIYQAAKKCFEDYDRIKTQILSSHANNRLINKSVKLKNKK